MILTLNTLSNAGSRLAGLRRLTLDIKDLYEAKDAQGIHEDVRRGHPHLLHVRVRPEGYQYTITGTALEIHLLRHLIELGEIDPGEIGPSEIALGEVAASEPEKKP